MTILKVLDLFCGAGGASVGIASLGHEVEGLDNNPELVGHYPYKLHTVSFGSPEFYSMDFSSFDAIWASPPCQHYSYATTQWRNQGRDYPDLVSEVRNFCFETNLPFVLENVPNAPLRKDLMLCMSMFDDGREFMVRRHRIFEIHGFTVPQPEHKKHIGRVGDGRIISVFGHGGGKRYNHASSKIVDWQVAMGMPWTSKRRFLSEAIPPEYSKYIFSFLTKIEN